MIITAKKKEKYRNTNVTNVKKEYREEKYHKEGRRDNWDGEEESYNTLLHCN
jgi:hypothetical protein